MSGDEAKKAMDLFVNSIATRTAYIGEGAKSKASSVEDSLKGDHTVDDAWAELGGNREAQ